MKVCEIFTSIQGESSYAGMPCTFIRMTGCNLRCTYCDTTYAYEEGTELSVEEILSQAEKAGIPLIEITGGEPLLQGEVYALMGLLLQKQFTVLIETNGSRNTGEVDPRVRIILDLKTPGSGMSEKMDFSNLSRIRKDDEVKFVLTGRTDYEWSKEIIHSYKLRDRCHMLMSPVYGILPPEKLAQWIIADRLPVRLNLQLHKYIFGQDRRGV
ncbi:MAG: radical SAM protein [Thermodesulfovibrionales bacterium]|nr:radical SAM protein [Thermodesulfovibrionales bacterium]